MGNTVQIVMPASNQEGTESAVGKWLKTPGETVREHEPLLEIATDKVTIEIAAPATGVLRQIIKHADEQIVSGDVLGLIEIQAVDQGLEKPGTAASKMAQVDTSSHLLSPSTEELSPAVRKLIREHNLDPAQISGSGKGGRITHKDVMDFLSGRGQSEAVATVPASRKIPHSAMRRSIAEHMVKSALKTAPHVTAVFDADLSAVCAHREKHKADFERKGTKLTYTAYFVQATCRAIKEIPEVNSRFHDDELEVYAICNIGIATAISGGLIVPVVKEAEKLDLFETAKRLNDLTTRAREGKLGPAEVQGGTFTITNHGVSGSLIATPIINQPQSAILGIGKLEKRAVVCEGEDGRDEIVIRPMVYVTLTIDHRALDGFQANMFLTAFVKALSDWS